MTYEEMRTALKNLQGYANRENRDALLSEYYETRPIGRLKYLARREKRDEVRQQKQAARLARRVERRKIRNCVHARALALKKRSKAYRFWLKQWNRWCASISASKSRSRERTTAFHFSYSSILGTHYYRAYGSNVWTKFSDVAMPDQNLPYDREQTQDNIHPGPPYNVPGIFRNSKCHYPAQVVLGRGDYYNQSETKKYSGGFVILPSFLPTGWDYLYDDPDRSYVSYGTQGWNKFRPLNPAVGLGVDLVEIAEIPVMFKNLAKSFSDAWKALKGKGSRKMISPSRLSAEFLGVNFGWFPFLRDVIDLVETTENLQSIMKQLRDKNGAWERKRGTITSSTTTEVVSQSDTQTKHWPVLTGDYYQSYLSTGSYRVIKRTNTRIWFSAWFKYYFLPSTLDSKTFDVNFKRHLYGLEISPTLLWQAMPWSWLVDWWSGFGFAFQNLDTNLADSLVSQNACVMGHESSVFTVESVCTLNTKTLSDSLSFSVEHGARDIASPYGFGYTWQNLSLRRLGILSALGITRLGHLTH